MSILSRIVPSRRPRIHGRASSGCGHQPDTVPATDRVQRILAQWHAERQQCHNVHGTGQELIEPYVLKKRVLNVDVDLLVGTVTTQQWYDKFEQIGDLDYCSQLKMIKPGDVVFDLGANNGFYSAYFGKLVGPTGRVYAFEPFATSALVARLNGELNGVNVQVFTVGISNRRRKLVLSSATERPVRDKSEPTTSVTLDTLDRYAHLNPDFLKIDIEGAEIDALAGAKKVLSRRPNICLEVHTHFFSQYQHRVEDLFDVLPMDDYICYIDHPERPVEVYQRQFPITEQCHLFLMKDEPAQRIYPR